MEFHVFAVSARFLDGVPSWLTLFLGPGQWVTDWLLFFKKVEKLISLIISLSFSSEMFSNIQVVLPVAEDFLLCWGWPCVWSVCADLGCLSRTHRFHSILFCVPFKRKSRKAIIWQATTSRFQETLTVSHCFSCFHHGLSQLDHPPSCSRKSSV